MIQFTEAIQLYNGSLQRLDLHQQRMNRTTRHFFNIEIDIHKLSLEIPQSAMQGLYKCRLVYDTKIRDIQWQSYIRKPRQRVMMVDSSTIDYHYKYCDRTPFDQLHQCYPADDLILVKNGYITDSLYANLVFENQEGLFTPDTFLLQGTRRQQLLNDGQIKMAHITVQTLSQYRYVHFINAMIGLGDIPPFRIDNILTTLY